MYFKVKYLFIDESLFMRQLFFIIWPFLKKLKLTFNKLKIFINLHNLLLFHFNWRVISVTKSTYKTLTRYACYQEYCIRKIVQCGVIQFYEEKKLICYTSKKIIISLQLDFRIDDFTNCKGRNLFITLRNLKSLKINQDFFVFHTRSENLFSTRFLFVIETFWGEWLQA